MKKDKPTLIHKYGKDLSKGITLDEMKNVIIDRGDIQIVPAGPKVSRTTSDGESYTVHTESHVIDKKNGKLLRVIHLHEKIPGFEDLPHTIKTTEKEDFENALLPIQGFSAEQLLLLKNALKNMGAEIKKTDIENAISRIIKESSNIETFALPSHALMFTLLAMFAGKPDKIPRRLLMKPQTEWTKEEKREAEDFFHSIIKVETSTSYETGQEETQEKLIAVVSDNPKVEAKAEISTTFFKDDLTFREISLAIYIKRTFKAEGLRHLLGLLIGLEENFRKGYFIWSINEHLERLGHRKKSNGSYDQELKKTATEIIKVFQSLFITARTREGKKEVIQGERLFSIDGFRQEIFDKTIIDEQIKLRATDFWYKNAFEPKDGQSGKYTKLLKKIAKENHQLHPLTIYLAPLLAIFWRMNPEQKISVRSLMDWCDLDHTGKYRLRDLRSLESELNYMKEHGYLGNWTSNGNKAFLSECNDPFSCSLTLIPPKWLDQEVKLIQNKREIPAIPTTENQVITLEEFKEIFEKSQLNVRQFGNHLGISGQMVSYILNGKRRIKKELSEKVREFSCKLM
jgi:hypothetical protein